MLTFPKGRSSSRPRSTVGKAEHHRWFNVQLNSGLCSCRHQSDDSHGLSSLCLKFGGVAPTLCYDQHNNDESNDGLVGFL